MPIVFKSTFNLLMFLLLIDKARQNEMNDFTKKKIGYMSGSICWFFIKFSGWVKQIIFYHLLDFQRNIADSLARKI